MKEVNACQAPMQAAVLMQSMRRTITLVALTALLASCGSSEGSRISAIASAEAAPQVVSPASTASDSDGTTRSAMKSAERAALKRANLAFQSDRIITPAGDNALEHALQARRINARSAGAAEILADIGPVASTRAQALIRAGELDDARRVIALLEEANPGSLTAISLQRQLTQAGSSSASKLASNQQR